MRSLGLLFVLLLLSASLLMLEGCGKSTEQKVAEERLNAQVMKLHEHLMEDMAEIRDLNAAIDIELANHDRLALQYPKDLAGRTADDLISARKMLLAAKSEMTKWISGYRPYDDSMNHDTVMTKLSSDTEALRDIQKSIESAKNTANGAIESHRQLSEKVAAAHPGKR